MVAPHVDTPLLVISTLTLMSSFATDADASSGVLQPSHRRIADKVPPLASTV
jgi:hypothetical protein